MDRIRDLFRQKDARDEYSPIIEHDNPMEGTALLEDDGQGVPFSWFEYSIFALLGMAMLWAWNMFLAAAPYFQLRFRSDVWITQNFQSAILTVSTITNLGAMLVLTNMQAAASYPFRINLALTINVVIFMLLTASTSIFLDASPALYLTFLLTMVAATALAAGLIQNGAFAFAASFSRPEYMQALMAGQGVAGVLPPLAQIMTVLAVPEDASGGMRRDGDASDPASGGASSSAFIYFLTAVIVSLVALGAFVPLVRRHSQIVDARDAHDMSASHASISTVGGHPRKTVSPLTLLGKLHWLSAAVALCFAVSMFFPGEREVAGGFMGLCLVTGLTVGSILSFTVAGI
ncbi:hypothetical protein VdG1_04424 [Verticillium dahliae VDG1]|nr:hypothetical protein VdG1_04424 [Verticillium dahliae VDG1]